MNDNQRTELLAAVETLSRRYPDWRLDQLIANVAGRADQEIWDVDDEQLLAAARSHLQQLPSREASPSDTARPGR
jgi:proline dehydrogenase